MKLMKLLLVVALLSGCGAPQATRTYSPSFSLQKLQAEGVARFYDAEAQVVCWTYYQSSIYCVPANYTMLLFSDKK